MRDFPLKNSSLAAGSFLRRGDHLHRVAGEHQDLLALDQRLRPGRGRVYVALIGAMLAGRAVWGLASWLIYALLTQSRFALAAFWMGGFVNAWPGMVLQVVLVPLIVIALERARLIPLKEK